MNETTLKQMENSLNDEGTETAINFKIDNWIYFKVCPKVIKLKFLKFGNYFV